MIPVYQETKETTSSTCGFDGVDGEVSRPYSTICVQLQASTMAVLLSHHEEWNEEELDLSLALVALEAKVRMIG